MGTTMSDLFEIQEELLAYPELFLLENGWDEQEIEALSKTREQKGQSASSLLGRFKVALLAYGALCYLVVFNSGKQGRVVHTSAFCLLGVSPNPP